METSSGFCSDPTVANRFNFSAPEMFACVSHINSFTDFTLNNIFTTIYGYMAIVITLFLASLCIIHQVSFVFLVFCKIDAAAVEVLLLVHNAERFG